MVSREKAVRPRVPQGHNIAGRRKGTLTKTKDYGYEERDEDRRKKFPTAIANIEPSQRVYVDQSGMDSRSDYGYGWSKRGQKFDALKSGRRNCRVNMIAAYCQKQLKEVAFRN